MQSFSYIPNTEQDRREMLATIGVDSLDALFSDIPDAVRFKGLLNLPDAMSEYEMMNELKRLARQNVSLEDAISFLGAGAYQHVIPSVVDAMISRSEFYTAYTPYQPEISQGILQAIFEYQTLMAELTGLDVSNASLYDGATAIGEAAMMACSHTRRNRVLVSATVNPDYRAVLDTYARGQHVETDTIAEIDGVTDHTELVAKLQDDVAAVVLQYPNFFGTIEDVRAVCELAHEKKVLVIVSTNPIALGLLESPGALGADIVVAEGQPLGNSLSFGGPYLGIITVKEALLRKLPGRIAGQTVDREGRRGFVLTLQAREQHIRREKASSNICSNQALNALAASVYLSYMGPDGLYDVAKQCLAKAHYARDCFIKAGAKAVHQAAFFHEFVLDLGPRSEQILDTLKKDNIFFGVPLRSLGSRYENAVLLAVTEVHAKSAIDEVANRLEGLL
ncbi:aminomethyl-transferring glycine dehydrogenase subunit GcvPA [Ferroacidibacillus organovorans]|uniref:Probable glycine dehydrogenase (decarboxylating) subunit 1 n=1 Tax=Ferroacidibacillus organovorans TaxID=1765683 RepID=A0A853KD92_9BACL|nr:aminomethyl-transferring glycine dehydrogenase subunit GcvPA [Ferroacidibacillus organovorans]KYP80622.1 glycine dehydrogenase [Ferroacidibacillus organovorans]OAG94308.1 glycine dehydrogenase [Ferroacidibacillus organovorans]